MPTLRTITARDAFALLESGEPVEILDVRQPDEYHQGHIKPSRLIPLGELRARSAELDPSRPILTFCRSGSRSAAAAQELTALGFDARNMEGGLLAWTSAKLPLHREE